MANVEPDRKDRRRTIVRLTKHGRAQARQLQEFLPKLTEAYANLFDEIGVDLADLVARTNTALDAMPLAGRMPDRETNSRFGCARLP